MSRSLVTIVVFGLAFAGSGCASFKSELVTRDETDRCWQAQHLNGIPITLTVPTHLRLSVIESRFYKASDNTLIPEVVGREVIQELVSTKKMFTVDFKRPGAGYLNMNASFSQDQYFKAINSEIQDRTIADISSALQRVLPLIPRPTNKGLADNIPAGSGVNQVKSVAAVGLFEITDPMFEANVQAFLQQHTDGCLVGPSVSPAAGQGVPPQPQPETVPPPPAPAVQPSAPALGAKERSRIVHVSNLEGQR